MLNEQIVNCPIIVFTGAGASRPLGKKLMAEFVVHLINKEMLFFESWEKSFLSYLAEQTKYDLEEILERLHTIQSLYYLEDDRMPYWEGRFSIGKLRKETRTMIAGIEKEIIDHYRVRSTEKLDETLSPLYHTVFSKGTSIVPFFTTNYDDALERFSIKFSGDFNLVDGFKLSHREWIWRPHYYHEERFDQEKKHVVLFKLHGSCDWISENGEIKRLGVGTYNPFEKSFSNVIIYPTKTKIALDEPYFTGYAYLEDCLHKCRMALFVGYSFRDYDSLSKIKNGLYSNKYLRLAILDPNGGYYRDTFFKEFANRVDVMQKEFEKSIDWINWLNERLNIALQNFPRQVAMTSPQPSPLGEGGKIKEES